MRSRECTDKNRLYDGNDSRSWEVCCSIQRVGALDDIIWMNERTELHSHQFGGGPAEKISPSWVNVLEYAIGAQYYHQVRLIGPDEVPRSCMERGLLFKVIVL